MPDHNRLRIPETPFQATAIQTQWSRQCKSNAAQFSEKYDHYYYYFCWGPPFSVTIFNLISIFVIECTFDMQSGFWGFGVFTNLTFVPRKWWRRISEKDHARKKFSAKFRIFVLRWTQVRRGRGMENYPFYCHVIKLTFACLNSKRRKRWKIEIFLSL